jgi:two-component system, sensor histidine kinase PdtaS
MAINELTANVVKYAIHERNSAVITVRVSEAGNLIRVIFQDDGPGYPDDVLRQERRNVGLDLIQQLLAHNLNGTVSLSNDHGAVTALEFLRKEK